MRHEPLFLARGFDTEPKTRKQLKRLNKALLRRKFAFLQGTVSVSTMALTASTAKTGVSLAAAANQPIKILEWLSSHDGATSTNAPDVTDIGRCTFGGAGTATSATIAKKDPGRQETVQTTGKHTFTAEPTTITVQFSANVAQYNGLWHYIVPFATPLIVVGGQGIVIRQTSPNNVNACNKMDFEE